MEKIILLGGGGHCKSVIDTIQDSKLYEIAGIIDLKQNVGKDVNGVRILDSDDNLIKYKDIGIDKVFITIGSIGDISLRLRLYDLAQKIGFKMPTIIDNTAIVAKNVKVEKGTFIGKGVIININSTIGSSCIINSGSIIEHDCIINDFVHVASGATLCGGVTIGKNTHIGANSTVIQYKNIGENVMIGAGSVVIKDIESNLKAYGNPCKEVRD
jgi:sugar O-acyltransferase (sialic acid O-acetyltransferase NeuD family)